MQLNEGRQQSRQSRPAIDPCKVERLKKLARETEMLAMELVCEVYGSLSGSGHLEPPVPDDGEGKTNVSRRRIGSDDGAVVNGAGHQEPPVPIVDALVCVAHGAKEICKGCDTLS